MSDLYPDQLDTITDPTDTDLLVVWDDSESKLKGITVADARTEMQAGAVLASTADAKGDLLVASAADTVTRLAVGTNGYVLTADSAESTGVKWAAAAGGGLPVQPLSDLTSGGGGPQYSGVPGVMMSNAGAGVALSANTAYYSPVVVGADLTISQAEFRVTSAAAAGKLLRCSIYEADQLWQPGALVSDLGAVTVDSTGRKTITSLSVPLTTGYYLARIHAEASCSIEAHYGACPWWSNHPVANNHPLVYTSVSLTYGAAEDPGTDATGVFHNATGVYSFLTFRWS